MPASRCMQARRKCGIARASDQQLAVEGARVWRGGLETDARERGIKILETPLGHPEFVAHQLQKVRQHQQTLLDRIPSLPDVQSAWALLLHCATARANCFIRLCRLTVHTRSWWPMMTRCGDVSVPCCGFLRTCSRVALGRLPRCHSPSVALASAMPSALLQRTTGQIGATPWR